MLFRSGLQRPQQVPLGISAGPEPLPASLLAYTESSQGLPHPWSAVHGMRTRFRHGDNDARTQHAIQLNDKSGRWTVQPETGFVPVSLPGIRVESVSANLFWLDVEAGMSSVFAELSQNLPVSKDLSRSLSIEALGCVVASYERSPLTLEGSYSALVGLDVK